MQLIPLQAIANQKFSITLDGNNFTIELRYTNGVMSISIDLNSVNIIQGYRVVAGMRVIPCKYQEAGNFIFTTQSFALPDYTQFGVTQQLIYATQAELDAIRQTPSLPITAAFFNPIAALPLRFKPQGY